MAGKKDETPTLPGDEFLAKLDARLAAFSKDVDGKIDKLGRRVDGLHDVVEAFLDRDDDDDDDDDDDGDDDRPTDVLPEVRAARRALGRDCPENIAEIAASLRKRGHRLRFGQTTGSRRATGGAVRVGGEATKVYDHDGKLVAQGRKSKRG